MVFSTIMHHVDVNFLREAYRRTRKDAAPGADGVTAEEYAENLEDNLQNLYERMRGGRYVAPPVRRAWLEKEDGSKRPIGVPQFEDKIVQRAVSMLLGAIYENDFYDFSYGFREGRNPHQAIGALREWCMKMNIGWIVDADVSGFFDNLDHGLLREIIERRVNDGGVLRYIGKWLNAGVLEGERLSYPKKGSPQGGVISPMLSNIFLHHVLDEWYEKEVKPRLKGRSFLIRFADDFIIGCEKEEDARKVMEVLPKRFNRFNLTIHPEKTTLVDFRKSDTKNETGSGNGTFDFLGFTHYWGKSRRGYWVIKRKTARKRLKRTISRIWQWCRNNRHEPLKEQYRILCTKLRGHYQYFGIRGNYRGLECILNEAIKAWRYWLSRRSSKSFIRWDKFQRILDRYPLPIPRIVHSI
jgi:group II intron reverse transcriptase/maturase